MISQSSCLAFKIRWCSCGELRHQASERNKRESRPGKNLLKKKLVNGVVDPIYDDYDNNKDIFNGDGDTTLVIQKILISPNGDLG